MKGILAAGLVFLAPLAASAQDSSVNRTGPATRDFWAARDGCENIPGQAHNSADCSRIDRLDPDIVLPDKPVSQMTGAELNLLRNHRILSNTAAALEVVRATAPKLTDEAVNAAVQLMATPTIAGAKIPRWAIPLCVKTQGLAPEVNAAFDRRIRQIATMVGAPVAEGACELNAALLFEVDPQAALRKMAETNEQLFAFSNKAPVMRSRVQAWYVTQTVDVRGNVQPDVPNPSALCDSVDLDVVEAGLDSVTGQVRINASKLRTAIADKSRYCGGRFSKLTRMGDGLTSSGFLAVTVVAAADLLKDHEPATLADHVALMALTRLSDAEACQPIPTIANLLKQGCAPGARSETISGSDLAFLLALYRAPQRESPVLQIGAIASEMKRALDGR
jgi:hypothetical protein